MMMDFIPCKWSNMGRRRVRYDWWRRRGEKNGAKLRERRRGGNGERRKRFN